MPGELDPYRGIFRWALLRSRHHRAGFWVGSVMLSLIVAVLIAVPRVTSKSTLSQRIAAGVLSVAIGVVVLVTISFVVSLFLAPFEQRNQLRQLTSSDGTPEIEKGRGSMTIAVGQGGTVNIFPDRSGGASGSPTPAALSGAASGGGSATGLWLPPSGHGVARSHDPDEDEGGAG